MFDRESIFALQVLDSRNGERGGKGVSKGKFGLPAASYPTIMLSKGSVMVTDRFHLGNLSFMLLSMISVLFYQPVSSSSVDISLLEFTRLNHPLFFSLILMIYFSLSEALLGQSFGKWLSGIVVKNKYGRSAGIWQVLLRNLFKLLWILWPFLLADIIILMLNSKSCRLGDIVAGTVVVIKEEGANEGT